MKQVLNFIRSLFGAEPSVEKITRPITSIMSKLDAYEAERNDHANRQREQAQAKLMAAEAAEKAARQAQAARQKFSTIFAE